MRQRELRSLWCDGFIADAFEVVGERCRMTGQVWMAFGQERQELWKVRKKAIGAMGRLAPSIVTHDGVIPRSKLPEMLDFARQASR